MSTVTPSALESAEEMIYAGMTLRRLYAGMTLRRLYVGITPRRPTTKVGRVSQ